MNQGMTAPLETERNPLQNATKEILALHKMRLNSHKNVEADSFPESWKGKLNSAATP